MVDEKAYAEMYEYTKDWGRVQFINELIKKNQEIESLKNEIDWLKHDREQLQDEIRKLQYGE